MEEVFKSTSRELDRRWFVSDTLCQVFNASNVEARQVFLERNQSNVQDISEMIEVDHRALYSPITMEAIKDYLAYCHIDSRGVFDSTEAGAVPCPKRSSRVHELPPLQKKASESPLVSYLNFWMIARNLATFLQFLLVHVKSWWVSLSLSALTLRFLYHTVVGLQLTPSSLPSSRFEAHTGTIGRHRSPTNRTKPNKDSEENTGAIPLSSSTSEPVQQENKTKSKFSALRRLRLTGSEESKEKLVGGTDTAIMLWNML